MDDYVVLILANGRPEHMKTVTNGFRKGNFMDGNWFIVLDNQDETVGEYKRLYGEDRIIVFNKSAYYDTVDTGSQDLNGGVVYARNAAFDIAEDLGYEYFIQLDDDYDSFNWRFTGNLSYTYKDITDLGAVFSIVFDWYSTVPEVATVAFSQSGEWMGGEDNSLALAVKTKRKAMNAFFLSTKRRFPFVGKINEDVNAYTMVQREGKVFLTLNHLSLNQTQTQKVSGGLTDLYLDVGTYVKSFYSVLYCPSGVRVNEMGVSHRRLHHRVLYDAVAPKVIPHSFVNNP